MRWQQGLRNIGALIIRIGFWGPLYYGDYNWNKEPPNGIGNYLGPYISVVQVLYAV